MAPFADRTDAGRRLAEELVARGVEADIVLAIPRGGLPLGRAVADELRLPLDIVVARKLGAPHNPELAIGAVGSDGSTWLNAELIERLDVAESYLESTQQEEATNARQKANQYRGDRSQPDLTDKRVLIVDDGVATGATTTACIRLVRASGATAVILAIPVGPPETVEQLQGVADEVICLETPSHFQAVGQFYERFGQVSDEEAMAYLGDETSP